MGVLRNSKHEKAAQAWVLGDCTKTEAYLAGFPEAAKTKKRSTINVRACNLFRRKDMVVRVQELEEQRARVAAKRFEVDASYVLERLVTIDKMDIIDVIDEDGRLRPVKEWPEVWRQFVGQFEVEEIFAGRGDERLNIGLLKKLKWPDKLRNLELLGKHVNVNAFKEVQEHTGPGGGPLRLVHRQMTAQEAAEAYADTLNNG